MERTGQLHSLQVNMSQEDFPIAKVLLDGKPLDHATELVLHMKGGEIPTVAINFAVDGIGVTLDSVYRLRKRPLMQRIRRAIKQWASGFPKGTK